MRTYKDGECAECAFGKPHNVVAYCSCGKRATGRTNHIWTVTERDGERVTLTPSFNWLIDPTDPSKGSHVHEFVRNIPLEKQH